MVPSTYEDGTLYNVLPSGNKAPDETGNHNGYDQTRADFTFSRGSNLAATRVNSDGLIEKGRENLLLQSNQFDTTWSSSNITLTSGQTGYDGSSNAWKAQFNGPFKNIGQTISASGVNTFSAYAKAGDTEWVRLSTDGTSTRVFFNIPSDGSGSIGLEVGVVESKIEYISNGWYRCSIIVNGSITAAKIIGAIADNSTSTNGEYCYIQNAQLEKGLVATDYIETGSTTAQAGILEDMPRINYDANGENGALLLESSRTNQIQHSEYIGSYWSTSNSTVSNNEAISPEGVQNAFELTDNSTNGYHWIYRSGVDSGNNHRISFFAKANTLTEVWANGGSGTKNASFDLSAGTILSTNGSPDATIEDYGDGWYRCSFTSDYSGVLIATSKNGDNTYVGTGESLYLYGIQSESSASYTSSYIPTHGAAVTRGADDAVSVISDTITDADTFTYYFEYIAPEFQSGGGELLIENASGHSQMRIYANINSSTPKIRFRTDNPSQNIDRDITIGEKVKGCFKVSNGTAKAFLNGSLEHTFNAATIDFKRLHLRPVSKIETGQMILFNEALSDSECESLTA